MKAKAAILTLVLTCIGTPVQSETRLSVKPTKCVAMNKGQVCYQKLRFRFSAPTGDYCLVSKTEAKPLKCWRATGSGQFTYPFQSSTDIDYQLLDVNAQPVASTSVMVAWVYKKSRTRNRWRLF